MDSDDDDEDELEPVDDDLRPVLLRPVLLRAVLLRAPPFEAVLRLAEDFDDDFFAAPARRAPPLAEDFLADDFLAEDFFADDFFAPPRAVVLRFAALLPLDLRAEPARAPVFFAVLRLAPPRADVFFAELFEPERADFFADDFFATAMITPPELE